MAEKIGVVETASEFFKEARGEGQRGRVGEVPAKRAGCSSRKRKMKSGENALKDVSGDEYSIKATN